MGLAFVVFCGGINKPKKPVNHALAVSGGELALVEVIVHPQPRTKQHDEQVILVGLGGGGIHHPPCIHICPLGRKIWVSLGVHTHQQLDERILFAHGEHQGAGALGPTEFAGRAAAGELLELFFPALSAKTVTIYQQVVAGRKAVSYTHLTLPTKA